MVPSLRRETGIWPASRPIQRLRWCFGQESNLHTSRYHVLNVARIPDFATEAKGSTALVIMTFNAASRSSRGLVRTPIDSSAEHCARTVLRCPWSESNRHILCGYRALNAARLPFRHTDLLQRRALRFLGGAIPTRSHSALLSRVMTAILPY